MLIGMARGIPGGVNGKGSFCMKGRVSRTLLFFFLVMYSTIPFFFEKHVDLQQRAAIQLKSDQCC